MELMPRCERSVWQACEGSYHVAWSCICRLASASGILACLCQWHSGLPLPVAFLYLPACLCQWHSKVRHLQRRPHGRM